MCLPCCLVNKTGKLVTANTRHIKVLRKSCFPQYSTVIHLPMLLKSVKIKRGAGGVKLLPSQEKVRFETVMNMHKPVAPDKVHPGLQRVWCRVQATLHHNWQVMTDWCLVAGEREMMHSLLKRVERRSLGTTEQQDPNLHIFKVPPEVVTQPHLCIAYSMPCTHTTIYFPPLRKVYQIWYVTVLFLFSGKWILQIST